MTLYAAPIEVMNSMMLMIGAKPINSIHDQSKENIVLRQLYEPLVQSALCRHAWTWATKTTVVQSSSQSVDGNYLYPVPSDFLNVRWVRAGGTDIQVEHMEDGHLSLPFLSDLELHGNWRVPEARWPADFAEAIVLSGYGMLLRSLLNDFIQADRADDKAEKKLRFAIVRDRRQIRGRDINQNSVLLNAWRGRKTRGSA
jgi:hypothetical protein